MRGEWRRWGHAALSALNRRGNGCGWGHRALDRLRGLDASRSKLVDDTEEDLSLPCTTIRSELMHQLLRDSVAAEIMSCCGHRRPERVRDELGAVDEAACFLVDASAAPSALLARRCAAGRGSALLLVFLLIFSLAELI